MLRTPCTEHVRNEDVLKNKNYKTKTANKNQRKHIMKKESLENLRLTRHIEDKRSSK